MGRLRLLAFVVLAALTSPAFADPLDRWAGPISEACARFGLPEQWIRRVMRAESGGVNDSRGRPIVSSAGAMGLMQLMPGTWRDMRFLLGLGPDPFDPHDNILAGAGYLRLMYDRFGYPGMFAAYNAGPARYAAVLAHSSRLPIETRNYVRKVIGTDTRRWTINRGVSAGLFANAAGEYGTPRSRSELFVALSGHFQE